MSKRNLVTYAWFIPAAFLADQLLSSFSFLRSSTHRGLGGNDHPSISRNNTDFPIWLSEYIEWHKKIRSDENLFQSSNILLVDQGTGGLGDRLKSLPYFLWLAAKHDRLLMIYWNTQCTIQEFLQPNTIDWSINVTKYRDDILLKAVRLNRVGDNNDYFRHLVDDAEMEQHKSERVLQMFGNHQTLTKGLAMVVRASNNDKRIFEYAFANLFRLANQVQELLEKTMKEIGLDDQEYIGVHLRARYPSISPVFTAGGENIDGVGIKNATKEVKDELMKLSGHAIQCTRMAHGGSNQFVYFASDTLLVMEMQHQSDKKVVYLPSTQERSHFSHGETSCSAYYPALIDLWILSQAQCIGAGVGGYSMLATMMNGFKCYTFHQFNSMLRECFTEEDNFFIGVDGKMPECLLSPTLEK